MRPLIYQWPQLIVKSRRGKYIHRRWYVISTLEFFFLFNASSAKRSLVWSVSVVLVSVNPHPLPRHQLTYSMKIKALSYAPIYPFLFTLRQKNKGYLHPPLLFLPSANPFYIWAAIKSIKTNPTYHWKAFFLSFLLSLSEFVRFLLSIFEKFWV